MKRMISLLLVLCLSAAALAVPASAAEPDSSALQAVQALGILQGDENGDLMLGSYVTRAQFVTMMTRASIYKDTIGTDGSGYSLFKDVKSNHWASEYIALAVRLGWASGYTDGSFRPDQTITLEEACTMLLRLLGYDSSALAGSFPAAQLNKASALGLRDGISAKRGEVLTRGDCAQMLYHLLTAQNSNGQVYGTTLGYTVTDGEIDYTSVVRDNLSGPYIAGSGSRLPFTPTTVYRDGKASGSAALEQYDVYYYNAGLSTAWIYTERVSGKITALSPNGAAPTSVTVAGKTYSIGSSAATYQLSAMGGSFTGSMVTLLLGMDDAVVGVVTGDAVETVHYGVVQSCSKNVTEKGNAAVETTVSVICTDGVERSFTVDKETSYSTGRLVSVNVTGNGTTIRQLSEKSLSGKVTSDGSRFGEYAFAANVKILDTSSEGNAVKVEPERLAGYSLSSSSVRYYALNEKNEIEHLVLKDATGDTWTYAYLCDVEDASSDMNINVTYSYLLNGEKTVLHSSSVQYPVNGGGIGISYESDGSIKSMRQMSSARLTDLNALSAVAGGRKYALADNIQVYLYRNGVYYLTSTASVNAEDYTLTGWYDTGSGAAGGQIRVIIAAERQS